MTPPVVWPRPLQPGERVALVAASSALVGPETAARLAAGIQVLEEWGLAVESRPLLERHWGYLAGSDAIRREDLLRAHTCGAGLLACLRGGWGSARLLEAPLPLPACWLLGFSDVTSLLWAQWAQGRGGGVHGPLLTTLAGEPEWSRRRLRSLLFGDPVKDLKGTPWREGVAEGPLLVANLTVATHLLGTPHLPALQGAILVLEDVGEAPYRIDRMLTHWRLSGALQQLGGLGLGQFSDCEDRADEDAADEDPGDGGGRSKATLEPRFSLEQVLRERTLDLGIPVLADLPVGHVAGNAALPLGRRARLDAGGGRLQLLE